MNEFLQYVKEFFQDIGSAVGAKIRRWIIFGFAMLCLAIPVWLFFAEYLVFFTFEPDEFGITQTIQHSLRPFQGFFLMENSLLVQDGIAIVGLTLFGACLIIFTVIFLLALLALYAVFARKEILLTKCTKAILTITSFTTGLYFVSSFVCVLIINNVGGYVSPAKNVAPFIVALLIDILFAVFVGICRRSEEEKSPIKKPRGLTWIRLEFFASALLMSAITLFALFSNILSVEIFSNGVSSEIINISGIDLFKDRATIKDSGQTIIYCLFTMTILLSAFTFLTISSYFGKSTLFYKLTFANIIVGVLFCLLTGLFGKYYEIIQDVNKETIGSILTGMGFAETLVDNYHYTVKSSSIFFFFCSLVLLAVVLFRRPYSKALVMETELAQQKALLEQEKAFAKQAEAFASQNKGVPENLHTDVSITDVSKKVALGMNGGGGNSHDQSVPKAVYFADPCPAFTELDEKQAQFAKELEEKRQALFESPTLPKLVQFIVEYARDSRLHLSYTSEDIATFVAGLGTTRLTILQGMSGTGKTSLPKIFAEALFSKCEIIEVESSWRDKNELLGYYNEFSKIYTPKKFTQALYRAKLNPEVLTFIVLDEMNLSRIEYYFSDFLSLMENEPDQREIKLLNVALHRVEEGEKIEYAGLTDGHTLKIPENVWFIGTANRDESTFEISDKVYDRAHTMNFNKRAKKVLYHNEAIPQRFIPVDVLSSLFAEAQNTVRFNIDNYPAISQAEKLLAPYNISFGNRIAMQMESFVNVYSSCFAPSEDIIHDAVEKILLSKVVSKLELKSVENKDELALAFEELGFAQCGAFIKKLNED